MPKTFHASFVLSTLLIVPVLRAQTSGTSHPEELNDAITTTQPVRTAKPSPAVPATQVEVLAPGQSVEIISPAQPTSAVPAVQPARETYVPAARRATPVTATPPETASVRGDYRGLRDGQDDGEGVVVEVPSAPNELPSGTLMHVALSAEISTVTTQRGEQFSGRLLQPLRRRNEVLIPADSVLTGRITDIHAGNRMHGGPLILLVPEAVTLPDGTRHRLEAQVVDLPQVRDAKVTGEGRIRGTEHWKRTVAGAGLTTGSATVAGAVIGGGVGAAVGATVGLGVATVWYFKHEQEQSLPANTEVVFSLDRPLFVAPGVRP